MLHCTVQDFYTFSKNMLTEIVDNENFVLASWHPVIHETVAAVAAQSSTLNES